MSVCVCVYECVGVFVCMSVCVRSTRHSLTLCARDDRGVESVKQSLLVADAPHDHEGIAQVLIALARPRVRATVHDVSYRVHEGQHILPQSSVDCNSINIIIIITSITIINKLLH